MVQFLASSVKVLTSKEITHPVRVEHTAPMHITIGIFTSADGDKLKQLLISSSLKEFTWMQRDPFMNFNGHVSLMCSGCFTLI